jgi:preprotein translocase subunit SecG
MNVLQKQGDKSNMKKKSFIRLLVMAAFLLAVFPFTKVQAKETQFPDLYVNLTTPEDTVIITKDTPNMDESWNKAGITDPQKEKKSFNEMGVKAILYDPSTKVTVRLMQKQSSKSKDIFNLSLLSEADLNEFLAGFVSNEDKSIKSSIEKYSQAEMPFFHYTIEMNQEGVPFKEAIYGTIVNGYALNFDTYKKTSTESLDETFLKELVDGTHFTEFLDKAEVQKQIKRTYIVLAAFFLIIVALIVFAVVMNKNRAKKQKDLKTAKTDSLTKFYLEQKQKEEQNIKESILYVNHTQYTEEVIKDFCYYNEIIKNMKLWVIMGLLFLGVLAMLSQTGSAFISCTIAIILLFVFVYYQGIRIEKLVARTKKLYDKDKSKDAVFTFYEDYFTMSGIQFISKYPYLQVTDIREYKNYIYLYQGDKAFYLKKDGFETSTDEFMKFINQKLNK